MQGISYPYTVIDMGEFTVYSSEVLYHWIIVSLDISVAGKVNCTSYACCNITISLHLSVEVTESKVSIVIHDESKLPGTLTFCGPEASLFSSPAQAPGRYRQSKPQARHATRQTPPGRSRPKG